MFTHDIRARRGRWLTIVGVGAVLAIVSTTTAISAAASERAASIEASRAAAISEFGQRVGIGASGFDPLRASTAASVESALGELRRATDVLARSSGKASEASRSALSEASERLMARAADAAPGSRFSDAVFELRELQKAVTDEVTAWQAAEDARLAAEAEAAAAAAAAAAAETARSYATSWSAESVAVVGAPDVAQASPATVADSASSSGGTPPANDACGPCPGATLVPIEWDGQTYWGCP